MEDAKKTLKVRIKYGFCGLKAKIYSVETGSVLGEITVSKDNRKIFEFLGFDYDVYLQGFDTKQEIFDFVVNGKYFDPERFQMHKLNHIDRKRNAKRATYHEFLTFINDNTFKPGYKFKRKDIYYKDIDKFFPEANFLATLKDFRKKEKERKIIASKFNGDLVMEWTGLKDKSLGIVLGEFRKHIVNSCGWNTFNDYCMISTKKQVKSDFDIFYKSIK